MLHSSIITIAPRLWDMLGVVLVRARRDYACTAGNQPWQFTP
jgi:hypothetical protein